MEKATHEVLHGLIDMHIHSAPDVQPRWGDDIDIVRAARQAGLRAVLLKAHHTLTADRAAIAEKVVGGIRVFGGLVLNVAVGGLNPAAVEVAIGMGARQIWMPTLDAAQDRRQKGRTGGLTILTAEGKLQPALFSILELIRAAGIMLGTGHISPAEAEVLVTEARAMGLPRIVITHPDAMVVAMPVALQQHLTGPGVFFERCFMQTTHAVQKPITLAAIVQAIRAVGVESTVISTDFGSGVLPPPVEGFRHYLTGLAEAGFSTAEIKGMAAERPAYLLGLDTAAV